MDLLDWRRGKPPITYCVTYGSMTLQEEVLWSELKWDSLINEKCERLVIIYKNS